MRIFLLALLFWVITAEPAPETPEEFLNRLSQEEFTLPDVGDLAHWFEDSMQDYRDLFCSNCMKICKNRKAKFRPGSKLDQIVKFNPWFVTDRPRDPKKCPDFCGLQVRANLYDTVDKLVLTALHLVPELGPEDPRRDTVNEHGAHAKSRIPAYTCYPDDFSGRKRPNPVGSGGPGTGFGDSVRAPSNERSNSEGDKGKGNGNEKTSEGDEQGADDVMGFGQIQDQDTAGRQYNLAVGLSRDSGPKGTKGSATQGSNENIEYTNIHGIQLSKIPGSSNNAAARLMVIPAWLKAGFDTVMNRVGQLVQAGNIGSARTAKSPQPGIFGGAGGVVGATIP